VRLLKQRFTLSLKCWADAKLLTDREEIKSQSLFSRLNSKETVTGENATEDSELKYLSEIREVRDKNPDLFERIKRLPKKARSTRLSPAAAPCQTISRASHLFPPG
jgi:hypothetical protein